MAGLSFTHVRDYAWRPRKDPAAQAADRVSATAAAPAEAHWIQRETESFMATLNAAQEAGTLSPDELIVNAYQLTLGRPNG